MMRLAASLFVLFAFALPVYVGCGDSKPKQAEPTSVSGSVTLDKQPLEDGEIHFKDVAGGFPPDVIKIKGGKYDGQSHVGKQRVEVYAYRPSKQKSPMPGVEVGPEQYVPKRYNAESTLETDLKAGTNTANFDVTSQ
jgi:hypothetical protein